MRMAYCAALLLLSASTAWAQAPWNLVRRYLQPGVSVVTETPQRLVLLAGDQRLVLAIDKAPDVDIFGLLTRNRDGNPYRVWRATNRFWNDADRPRAAWGQFLRADFLRLIRAPEEGQQQHPTRTSLYLPVESLAILLDPATDEIIASFDSGVAGLTQP